MGGWFCPVCGHENAPDALFCESCGTALPTADATSTVPAPAVQVPVAATSPVGFKTGEHYKVHKSYIYLGPVVGTLGVIVLIALNGMQGWIELFRAVAEHELPVDALGIVLIVVGGILLLLALMVGLYALAYRNMSYVFDEREFSFYSGILVKRQVHVPYARVQSVNHRATIIQRIAGVCTIVIDSAGGAQNKAVRVPYVTLADGELIRRELFTRKAYGSAVQSGVVPANVSVQSGAPAWVPAPGAQAPGQVPVQQNVLDDAVGDLADFRGIFGGGDVAGMEPVSFECGLTNKELVLTAFSHSTPITVAAIVGISLLVTVLGIIPAEDEVARFIAMFAVPGIIVITLLSYLVSVASIAISYGRFSARRRGSRIEVERGILQRVFSGIDIERVQLVEVRQSAICHALGYCEVALGRISSASDGSGSSGKQSSIDAHGLVIHPFVKVDRVDELLAGLTPEFADRPRESELSSLPPVALRRAIMRRCVWFNWLLWLAVLMGAAWAGFAFAFDRGILGFASVWARDSFLSLLATGFWVVAVICVLVTGANAFGAVLWARRSGYAVSRKYVTLRNDGLGTRFVTVPRQKIQSGHTRSNPFQRRLDLTSLHVITAAGTSSTAASLLDVPAEAGAAYLDWLKPRHE